MKISINDIECGKKIALSGSEVQITHITSNQMLKYFHTRRLPDGNKLFGTCSIEYALKFAKKV